MKTCNRCEEDKPLSEFYKDSKMKDGYRGNCKACHIKQVTPTTQHQYKVLKYGTSKYVTPETRRPAVPSKTRVHDVSYRDTPFWKRRNIASRYGMTLTEYCELYEKQDGRCAICNIEEGDDGKMLCVDHCHDTGEVRGLLCATCNIGIGMLKDSPEYLRAAIEYLSE